MDGQRFDQWARAIPDITNRRQALLAFLIGGATLLLGGKDAVAKRKKRKKVKRNAFDCVSVGRFCKKGSQCCSGICRGKKGKKRCQAHDVSTCQVGQTTCAANGEMTTCQTSGGKDGFCETTTGNAGYCSGGAQCFACTTDSDCRPFCGENAACIQCASGCGREGGTACAGLDGCNFPP